MSSYLRAVVAGGAFVCAIMAVPAISGASFSSNSCISGFVDAHDYAELETNLAESFTDNRARLDLVSESAELTLAVTNLDGTSVCENVADLNTSCHWTLGSDEVFIVKVDNTMRSTETAYELCAR